MALQLYMDEHVPRPITAALRRLGVDVLTVQDDGRAGAPDPDVLDRAAELHRVVFSQDHDFLLEGVSRQRSGGHFAGVIYGDQLGLGIGRFVEDLLLMAQVLDPATW